MKSAAQVFRVFVLAGLAAGLLRVPVQALPVKGSPAPAIAGLNLLRAPAGTRLDWASLRGKVVVLEFWATWCAPCIASLPHQNQLVDALDAARFQFVSIDDEDPKVVEAFLTRKKVGGLVGIDGSGAVFARYGVKQRPTTIVVDARGRIVAATEMEDLSVDQLKAVADGRPVSFKAAMEVVTQSASASPVAAAAHPLFSVSFSKAAAGAKFAMVKHPPTGTDYLGIDAATLLTYIWDPISRPTVVRDALPEGLYDLRVELPGVPQAEAASMVQTAVFCGLHLQVVSKTMTRRELLLKAVDGGRGLLSPSVSNTKSIRGYWNGGLRVSRGTMDDLAAVLETGLETPVENRTGIEGRFDVRFNLKLDDVAGANAALRELGLELVPGAEDRSVTLLEVVRQGEGEVCSAESR